MFDTVESLRNHIVSGGHRDPAYVAKMFQHVPDLPTVADRGRYLTEKARGKIVLDIGCTGPISAQIKAAAKKYYGVDRVPVEGAEMVELDHRPDLMPKFEDVELVICSEVLEHLSNPGYFLLALAASYPQRDCYFTVPNAGAYQFKEGVEIVNAEHVCWYSYATLKALLTRYNYVIKEARWYNGQPFRAEGIIMLVNTP